jgi:hypothetical protein
MPTSACRGNRRSQRCPILSPPSGFGGRNSKARRFKVLRIPKSYFKTDLSCHPERSEGSQHLENTRFFATLRMTFFVKVDFEMASRNFPLITGEDQPKLPMGEDFPG